MEKILNGKVCKETLKNELIKKINNISDIIKLVVISVGKDEASKIYIKNKIKECESVNIKCEHLHYEKSTTKELIRKINELNNDYSVNGILVQLPLPKNIDVDAVINSIDSIKDVDGLTKYNIGSLYKNNKNIIPCTAKGILKLLDYYKINLKGKNVTIIGRGQLTSIPLIPLLIKRDSTVTICHSKTDNLKKHTKKADIIIIAIGKANFLKKNMIKRNSIIIDVGINRINNKICGDVDINNVINKVKFITPVPNGIGQMTLYEVLENTFECYLLQKNKKS